MTKVKTTGSNIGAHRPKKGPGKGIGPAEAQSKKEVGNAPDSIPASEAWKALATARVYLERGWHPVPLPYGMKSPTGSEWQQRTVTNDNVEQFFNSVEQNIGVQLGPKSNNLADVDLDCHAAVKLARVFLPETGAIFGRKSKPAAHYLFQVHDPEPQASIAFRDEKQGMICELRLGGGGKGAQTMFPGSMHPDGEAVEWESDGEPAEATCAVLTKACIRIAVGALLLRQWEEKNGLHAHHELALRVGGFLARAGWDIDDVTNFVGTIAYAADDREWKDRQKAARDACEKHSHGERIYGLPALQQFIGEGVANHIAHLIHYRETDTDELLERMNEKYAVVPIGGKVRVLTWEEERERQVAVFYGFDEFRHLLDNKKIQKGKRTVGTASWWLDHAERRQYDGLVFKPTEPQVVDNRLNLWRGWSINPRQGCWRLILRHIHKVMAAGDGSAFKYIIRWMTWALQNPDKQAEVSLVFRGGRGTGRGLFGRMMKDVFGQHGFHISSSEHLTGRFNAHMMDCALLFVDEAYWPGDKKAEGVLKRMHTEPTLTIEKKGVDTFEVHNALKIIIVSNEDWVVPAGADERRFAVFNVSSGHKQDRKYFAPLYEEIADDGVAAMMYDLLKLDLKGWHPRDDVPQTRALREQKERSLSGEEQWWLGLLQSGELPGPEKNGPVDIVHKKMHEQEPNKPGYDAKVVNPRLALSSKLFEDARKTVMALRHMSDVKLSAVLKSKGCDRDSDWRICGMRAWQFPTLKEARAVWDEMMGVKTDWEDAEEWSHPSDVM